MRKRRYLFPGMAVILLFTILFAAGYTTPAIGNVNTVQAATKKKDLYLRTLFVFLHFL